jgi:type IV fimbrial biogenesis protein FimT
MSLIELLVTLAIGAIVIGLGAPTMLRVLARHAILAEADELQDAVRIGRNEAMKRSGPVVLCRTDAANTSHCAGSGGDWRTWLLFADSARSGAFVGGDTIVRQHLEASRRMTVTSDAASVRFEATGIAHADRGQVVFVLSPTGSAAGATGGDPAQERQVCVNPRGAVAVIDGNATCP